MARWTEMTPLADLRPDPRNPRAHDNADDLRASLGRWGYVEQVTVDERTGLLVAGHGRRALLLDDLAEGRDPPDGVDVDGERGWLVPVSRGWSSADDDEAYGYMVASNRLTEGAGWRRDLLADGLRRLAELDGGAGLAGTGYSAGDLGLLLSELAGRPEPEPPGEFPAIDPDSLPTEHACPKCGYRWSGDG